VTVRNVFLPRNEGDGQGAALQKSLADRNRDFDETVAREMFLYLIQPVLSGIRSERLVIIPHEDLHYVPFQVFQDPADGVISASASRSPMRRALPFCSASGGPLGSPAGGCFARRGPRIEEGKSGSRAIAKLFPGTSKVVTDTLARESDVKAWSRESM